MAVKREAQTVAQQLAEEAKAAQIRLVHAAQQEAHEYYTKKALPMLRNGASEGLREGVLTETEDFPTAKKDKLVELLHADGFSARWDYSMLVVKW